jgi:hypothetical protein
MNAVQQSLFGDNSPVGLLKEEVRKVKESSDNVRRGVFARQNEIMKICLKQQAEIDELKRIIKDGVSRPELQFVLVG